MCVRRGVSIHARLATGDLGVPGELLKGLCFNSRPSCDGRHALKVARPLLLVSIHARLATGDPTCRFLGWQEPRFQFTPVLRRATPTARPLVECPSFNSRPSCDGRPSAPRPWKDLGVSIHARLATGDPPSHFHGDKMRVSIHARLATGDLTRGRPRPST